MDFFARLDAIVRDKGSALCVGLDPRVAADDPDPKAAILAANRRLIEATAPYAAAFKPNIAFYEAFGPRGLEALEESIALVPDGIPVIVDAKRCDIDATAEAYATAIFGRLKADAVTLSPYMGKDAAVPFLKHEGKGLFLLCRTSNPGAVAFQDLLVEGAFHGSPSPRLEAGGLTLGRASSSPEALYIRVARECLAWSPAVGLVVAGNDLAALRSVRAAAPGAWFLSPGIGAQGGDPALALAAGRREDGRGVLVVAARAVSEAADPAAAARELRDKMEAARKAPAGLSSPGFGPGARAAAAPSSAAAATGSPKAADPALKKALLEALISTECFKLGDFVLKSGKRSPFYIDLRRLVSDPAALALAGRAYASLAEGADYARVAGIPAAALPLATAACLALGRPMVWPRMPVKEHGTGNRVEGAFKPGERVLLLDDLITTGASKLEAAEILRGEGLVVADLAVLIERGKQGRRDMEAAGIALRAFVHVRELFAVCESLGLVDAARRRELEAYVDQE
ncbi:MAG: orotidine-5'-phosphate decarboxylase [Spirochaetaceae bacterium]|nr:orotidine-5'-phosphate decarboxylase [Spirochaetaceae bacterium]